jgi:hypothetical protein
MKEWFKQHFALVVNHKPYLELEKSGQAVSSEGLAFGPSGTVSLVTSTRAEADAVAAALRQKYSISP